MLFIVGNAAFAEAACETTPPEPCPDCFAVFVMPDTQHYTTYAANAIGAGQGRSHFELMTSWICSHRGAWREPRTGKTMPIVMVLHLGDIVDNDHPTQWVRADAAFDHLDACATGAVPYLVTAGNHDLSLGVYEQDSHGYFQYFNADPAFTSLGPDRWAGQRCADPAACTGEAG